MFNKDKNIDSLKELFEETRNYVLLQKDYVKLDIIEKMTKVLSMLFLILISILLGIIALFYLSFTIAYILRPYVGGLSVSFAIITLVIICIIIFAFIFRKALIIHPITNLLANILFNDKE